MEMPAGLAAPSDIRRLPDSSTEQIYAVAPGAASSDRAAVIHPEGDLSWRQEQRRGRGTVSIASQGNPATTPSHDRSLVALPEPGPLIGQNCTVLLTDVVGFGSQARDDEDRLIIRDALFHMTCMMLQGITGVRSEDRGDGMLTIAWPDVPTWMIIDRLLRRMLPALLEHNRTHNDTARFQLRVAIDVGPVFTDVMGFNGRRIIDTSRLIDAPQFKKAMEASGADLGLITTNFIHETALKHDRDLAGYCQVRVKVKEHRAAAWIKVFDTEVSPHSAPGPALAC